MNSEVEYRPGDRVRVTAIGEVSAVSSDLTALSIRIDGHRGFAVRYDLPGVTVERLTPAVVAGRLYRDPEGHVGLVRAEGGRLWIYWVTGGGHPLDQLGEDELPLTQVWPALDAEPEPQPDAWPPQGGDEWISDSCGDRWSARVIGTSGLYLVRIGGSIERTAPPAQILEEYPDLRLVSRATPAEPLHTWPPDRPGLWYLDRDGAECESFEAAGELMIFRAEDQLKEGWSLPVMERRFGPMTPIATPGGAL